ncbi:copper resistance D family protein [Methylocella sp.]|uniref:copper resistance D family protein n=1 Tax=Methylocella sp. TaxID=1978226 RepID=UPI0035B370ED
MSLFVDIFGFLSVVLRGLILSAQSFMLGGLAFMTLLLAPLAPRLSADATRVGPRSRRLIRVSALCFSAFVACSLTLNAATLVAAAGESWMEALGADFARADFALIAAALLIALLCGGAWSPARAAALAALGAATLASQTMLTHAASRADPSPALLVADPLHMLGAAVWIGGLPYLLVALQECRKGTDWRLVGRRYSLMAMASVAAIVLSGVVMAVAYVGSPEAFYGTAYGVMIATKIVILLMLLALGGANYLLVERLRRDPSTPILRLRRFAEVEIGLGLAAIAAAASVTSLPPSVDLTQDRLAFSEIVERYAPRPPRLTSPDHDALTISQLQRRLDAEAARGEATSAPRAFVPGESPPLPRNAADVAWSEYNHHWAGVFVLVIGVLAMVERFPSGRWARHWPLLFVLMAAFLFVRADEQAWPLGPIGFFESMRDPEVAQHRVVIALVALFGLYEWRVRARGADGGEAALFFPLATAAASVMLLAHSHSIGNVKEELLIELSHTPMALLGLVAAFARWLELRLEGRAARIAGWIWPVCFALIGLVLLDYREA